MKKEEQEERSKRCRDQVKGFNLEASSGSFGSVVTSNRQLFSSSAHAHPTTMHKQYKRHGTLPPISLRNHVRPLASGKVSASATLQLVPPLPSSIVSLAALGGDAFETLTDRVEGSVRRSCPHRELLYSVKWSARASTRSQRSREVAEQACSSSSL